MFHDEPHFPYHMPPEGTDALWRAEAQRYAYCIDPDAEHWGTTAPRLELRWYSVKRRTSTGARLEDGRFTSLKADEKQWASETPEEAVRQLIMRRRGQVHIVSAQLRRAEADLEIATAGLEVITKKAAIVA